MKKIWLITGVIIIGVISCLGGYFLYSYTHTDTETDPRQELVNYESNHNLQVENTSQNYYLIKTDQKMLKIYEMPQKILFDVFELQDLYLPFTETELKDGIRLHSLEEVYEFLENSMS